ncbi:MAG: hypothetical protein H6555_09625 [Lewinellaceae bacterium]|nr:hypothetical protein [Lewinellaceae bacterium]
MRPFKLIFFLFTSLALSAQTSFPADWAGVWVGDLQIYNYRGLTQTVPMELRILPHDTTINTYTWTMVYGQDTVAGLRPYLLRPEHEPTGHYVIDEGDGILLDCYRLGNTLYDVFSVQGTLLNSRTELRGDELHYEIISGPQKPARVSGGTGEGEEAVPAVESMAIHVLQRAVLKRKQPR